MGELIAFVVIFFDNPRYVRKLEANNNIPVPEWRLPIAMVGGVLFSGRCLSVPSHYISANVRLISPCSRSLLVWLDGLYRARALDRPRALRPLHRLRHLLHLPLAAKLHRRRVPHVRRLRHRSKHLHALSFRRRFPALRHVHVRRHGHPMGVYSTSLPLSLFCAFTLLPFMRSC